MVMIGTKSLWQLTQAQVKAKVRISNGKMIFLSRLCHRFGGLDSLNHIRLRKNLRFPRTYFHPQADRDVRAPVILLFLQSCG